MTLGVHTGALKVGDPGYSNTSEHRYGLAVDLGTPNGNSRLCSDGAPNTQTGWSTKEEADAACTEIGGVEFAAYEWLNENASRFGMFNRGGEPWHWSTSGN